MHAADAADADRKLNIRELRHADAAHGLLDLLFLLEEDLLGHAREQEQELVLSLIHIWNDREKSREVSDALIAALEKAEQTDEVKYVLDNREFLAKKSVWACLLYTSRCV